ncbi:MAG: hypothetical protein J6K20_01035 [Thermoguttaceae bacterium]|nr:hypothetical protein [Thermoguttaceae bacterium]MBQ2789638.1 hypothetical protein [Thermoguttaceae bacterium]MBQ6829072.1 hypothetical protein [Thermoguttaceae bacterium]MBQ7110193.1 hypothetical protein [Thermoguttaceae bacterium]
MTFAEVDAAFDAKRLDDWDRAAFVAAHAINANPYLRRPVDVRNPLRAAEEYRRVELEDVPGLN